MTTRTTDPRQPFEFAGFRFPRKVPIFRRLNRSARGPRRPGESPWSFAYTVAPRPLPNGGIGFYHESDLAPGLRWQWCDKVEGVRIDHEGWFSDSFQDQTIRGIVFRLPRSRGFLAGWSMGKGMCGDISRRVYRTEREAARAANREAESVAEREREYQEHWRAGQEEGEAWREAMAEARDFISAARDMRRAARVAMRRALAQSGGVAAGFVPPDVCAEAVRLYRQALQSSREKAATACEVRREAWRKFRDAVPCYDKRDREAFMEGAGL